MALVKNRTSHGSLGSRQTTHTSKNYTLIKESQHGFRKGRSCLTNLLVFLVKVSACLDEGQPVDVIYLDFAKAFDKVPHKRLLEKIAGYGIRGKVLQWITDGMAHKQTTASLSSGLFVKLDYGNQWCTTRQRPR